MAKARVPPAGVHIAVPTFLHEAAKSDGLQAKVDIETQVKYSVSLAKAGAAGLGILGSTGEAIHLTRQERINVVAGCKKGLEEAGFPDFPLIAGVLTNGIEDALDWLRDYAKAGAQWGLVLVPGFFGTDISQTSIREWFTVVADNSPIPILVYNYPKVVNQLYIEPSTYRELSHHPNIVGCKMSHGNLSFHMQVGLDPQIDHDNFKLFSGFGGQIAPLCLFGAAGVIDAMAAIFPKTYVRVYELASQRPVTPENLAEIQKLSYVLGKAEDFVDVAGIAGIKEAVHHLMGLGLIEGGRLPLKGQLAPGRWEELKEKYFMDIDAIERSL